MPHIRYLIDRNQLDFKDIFNYEFDPVSISLFEDSGKAHYLTAKSVLINILKLEL